MKYPGMKIPTLRETKREGARVEKKRSPQMFSQDGNGRGQGAARKHDRMQARRSWNQFKRYQPAPPFSASPPTPPPFSSPSLFLPPLAPRTALQSAAGGGENGSLAYFEWGICCFIHTWVLFLCISCTLKRHQGEQNTLVKEGVGMSLALCLLAGRIDVNSNISSICVQ